MDLGDVGTYGSRLNDALEALQKAEQRALAGLLALEVIHEIRNPLDALSNLHFLTNGHAAEPDSVRYYMQLATEQTRILNGIVRTLGFARTSQARSQLNLCLVAEAALRIHAKSILSKHVQVVTELADEVMAEVHSGEVLQVVSNLLANALDALADNGTIRVRLKSSKAYVRIIIIDNGRGVPRHHLAKIFEPFFTTKDERGTGLGLALSKKIIESHGGCVRIRSSVAAGCSGTLFRIVLPSCSKPTVPRQRANA